jgi:hypothetical protein
MICMLIRRLWKTGFPEADGKCPYARLPKSRGMRRTQKYAAVPPARRAYAPEGRGMRVTQQMGVFRQPQDLQLFHILDGLNQLKP